MWVRAWGSRCHVVAWRPNQRIRSTYNSHPNPFLIQLVSKTSTSFPGTVSEQLWFQVILRIAPPRLPRGLEVHPHVLGPYLPKSSLMHSGTSEFVTDQSPSRPTWRRVT